MYALCYNANMKMKQYLLVGFFVLSGAFLLLISYFVSEKDNPTTIKANWFECNCVNGQLAGDSCPSIVVGLRCQ